MSLLTKVKPSPQSYPVDAYSVPGHLCFCRRIEIPTDLEKGEEEGFLLLELEGISPFPLEHLYYGYVLDAARRFGLVYAAYKRRFEGVDIGAWRRLDATLPDFLAGLGQENRGDSPLVLVTPKSLVAMAFDSQSELPCWMRAEARVADREESTVDAEVAAFAQTLPSRHFGNKEPRIWQTATEVKWLGQTVWFEAVDAAGRNQARFSLSRSALWKADMRDPEMVARAKKDERQNALLWKGVVGLAAAVSLLLLGELLWGASYGYLALRREWNADRQPMVAEIDMKQQTSNTLFNYLESNLAPFEMIEALRPLQDWPNVVYRRFETGGPDTLVIAAYASNRSQVTAFKNRLENDGNVLSVELSNQQNNPQGSTFTTTIHFRPGAFAGARETARNER